MGRDHFDRPVDFDRPPEDFFLAGVFFATDLFFGAAFFFAADRFFGAAFFFGGTLAPLSLASDSPMAMACFRLVTFFPLRPLFSVPLFFSCMAFSTLSPAFFEYFAIKLVFKFNE
jgi:hypothetical protein